MEILLAFGVSIIITVAMVSLTVVTVKAATINRAYAEAGKVAQSQSERLKQYRDTSTWSAFTSAISSIGGCATSCNIRSVAGVLSIVAGDGVIGTAPSQVTYRLTTVPGSPTSLDKEVKYTVLSSWYVAGVQKFYKIEGLLSDWRSI
jgi:hypothetical protein